ncbi:hypothetical protein ACFP7A_09865 [Sporolactobacillus kofuensis]|uniref:Soluble ligand binding domain-containing protein n=1 Tax=Sporolactobacillus kofuensis TaxID=269672 RepID=A0ABW1WFC3_9BACL|nr:hypothetical protein [Sporolactobacillus kofuensis]MCO7176182.1 hypothetical protein [Sporolactobacillus kofuensis]
MIHKTFLGIWFFLIFLILYMILPYIHVDAQPIILNKIIMSERPVDRTQLIKNSDLIVFAHIGEHINKWEIGQELPSGAKLVNASQILQIRRVIVGEPPSPSVLLTTGVEPLPDPKDPLNNLYTGPLADGDYLLFLKRLNATQYVRLSGGFSSVYPVVSGKTIALDERFQTFSGKSIDEIMQMLHRH